MILSIILKRWSSQVVHCCTRLTVGLMIHTKSQWKTQRSCRWAIIYIPRGIFFFIHTLHWVSSLSPRGWLLEAFLRTPPVSTWYCLAGFHIQPSYMSTWKTGCVNVVNDVRTWQRRRSLPSTKNSVLDHKLWEDVHMGRKDARRFCTVWPLHI